MKSERSYLMPFDEVIKMLIGKGLGTEISRLMRLGSLPAMRREDYPLMPAYRQCR